MTNFNVGQIMQMAQRGVDPNRLAQQLIQQNPAVQQAAQMMRGKTPDQIKQMAYNRAAHMGVDLNRMAQQMGIKLPD